MKSLRIRDGPDLRDLETVGGNLRSAISGGFQGISNKLHQSLLLCQPHTMCSFGMCCCFPCGLMAMTFH